MRYYVCGRMRLRPFYNYLEFDRVSALIRKAGHVAWNPADQDRSFGFDALTCGHPKAATGDIPYEEMGLPPLKDLIRMDVDNVLKSDGGVVTLPEWWMSVGGRAEVFCAQWAMLPLFHMTELGKLLPGPWKVPDDFKFSDAILR